MNRFILRENFGIIAAPQTGVDLILYGPLAQPVEHLTFNQVVGRSNRPRPTIFSQ